MKFNSIVYVIDPEKPVQEGAGSPAISQIDFAKVHLNRLLAEIELEQVSNVHIVFNLNTQTGRFRNVFASEDSNNQRIALLKFLCNQLEHQDLETTYSTVKFHYEILDAIKYEKQQLQKFFTKVIQALYMSASD